MIHYKVRLGVLKVGELRHQILVESHNSRNPIHAGATNMYGDPLGIPLVESLED